MAGSTLWSYLSLNSQSVVTEPMTSALPENLLEMELVLLISRPMDSDTWKRNPASYILLSLPDEFSVS